MSVMFAVRMRFGAEPETCAQGAQDAIERGLRYYTPHARPKVQSRSCYGLVSPERTRSALKGFSRKRDGDVPL